MAIVADLASSAKADPTLAAYGAIVNGVLRVSGGTAQPVQLGAQGTDANIGIVITPKGTGALTAHLADSAAAGGNARGTNAIDWQTVRTLATQVASGSRAVVAGGSGNTASGLNSTVGGGSSSVASGSQSTVGGGEGNVADGTQSWVPGGSRGFTRGLHGRAAWGSGRFATNGDAQAGEMVLRRSTTDATPTVLTSDGAAPGATNQYILPNNGMAAAVLLVTARSAAGKSMWQIPVLLLRDAAAVNTVVVAGTATQLSSGTVTGWTVAATADTTNGGLTVTATGAAATAIAWVARLMAVDNAG